MKKFLALILSFVMVLSLAACGDEKTPDDGNGGNADAVTWPNGDVTVYVPSKAGDPVDLSARLLCQYLGEKTGVTFVITNDDVGTGVHAAEMLRNAKADGQTLFFTGVGQLIKSYTGEYAYKLNDAEQFTIVGAGIGQYNTGSCWMVPADAPYNTLDEMVKYIEEHPGEVNMATSSGNPQEIKVRLFTDHFKITDNVKFVQARNNDLVVGLLNGSIHVGLLGEDSAAQYIQEGTLKALANNSLVRAYPDAIKEYLDPVPNYADLGLESLDYQGPMFILAPGGLDEKLAQIICDTINSFADNEQYMADAVALGRHSEFRAFSLEELRSAVDTCDTQLQNVFGN